MSKPITNDAWVEDVWQRISKKLPVTAEAVGENIAYTTDEKGKYAEHEGICWWTNGFWPGLLWLMYKETGDAFYRHYAERIEERLDEALMHFEGLHHDVGFMWILSALADYRLTGNQKSKDRALLAAGLLASRYRIDGGFIRAWNEDKRGWAIIDCMMNIPILYHASELTDDDRFANIAKAHADKAMEVFVRPDGSVNHIVVMEPETGEVIETLGGQGYCVGSSWSRGQAWAIYGFALSYIHTKNKAYLDTAKRVAHYFLADLAMKDDYVPDCDFRQPKEPVVKDSSAGAIAACGLIEIAKHVDEREKDLYLTGALKILKALDKRCGIWDDSSEALLKDGAEAYFATESHGLPLVYGDFYFVEAVLKLKGSDFLIW